MFITINGNKLAVTLENNSSVKALMEILKNKDITFIVNDYGNFEKVGNIGYQIPRNDKYVDTTPGDVILYQGNQISIYYDKNSWSFTKIGKITGYSKEQLKTLLGVGQRNLKVTISLA